MMNEVVSCMDRLEALRRRKIEHTAEKQKIKGAMDHDDHGLILPPAGDREVIQAISSSGMPIADVIMKAYKPKPNHPSGGFFGPRACGENFRALLDCHPVYIDPLCSLAGAYMVNFGSYRKHGWRPEFGYEQLREAQEKYQLVHGIGGVQHFCQDLQIGLALGWGGLLGKIRRYRAVNPRASDFYDGLEQVVLGVQGWIRRHVVAARQMAHDDMLMYRNLTEIADMNEWLAEEPPRTFREACQWILWYQLAARMYNGSGSLGRLDVLLAPYYEADTRAGRLTDEEAILHLAGVLLRDAAYLQLGGPDATGRDTTNPVSFLVLEAAHRLKIPANVGVCVGRDVDPRLFRRGVEILLEDRVGIPKFLGVDNTCAGFARNGFPLEDARQRAYSGCHWSAIPGREYAIMDCIKINFAIVFDVALREMLADPTAKPSVDELWKRFEHHLQTAVDTIAAGIDVHYRHMHEVFPELVMDLLCHGPIEKGLDASHGGVEYYTFGIDGAALATVADSLAAVEQRVEKEKRLGWGELLTQLDANWAGEAGERVRLMMKSIPRYGSGSSRADEWARRIASVFSRQVVGKPTPDGHRMIPGLFSWANTIPMGKTLGATPNGRCAGAPISHGSNPDPGFRTDGAPTALCVAVAGVQPGYGNAAPLQLDLAPTLTGTPKDVDVVMQLIRTHFDLGGTQININILDKQKVIEAHQDPSKFPDLIVRVTGFSAFFASLSPEFRQLVVDRIIRE